MHVAQNHSQSPEFSSLTAGSLKLTNTSLVPHVKSRGLSCRWETIDGKLICRWFRQPD